MPHKPKQAVLGVLILLLAAFAFFMTNREDAATRPIASEGKSKHAKKTAESLAIDRAPTSVEPPKQDTQTPVESPKVESANPPSSREEIVDRMNEASVSYDPAQLPVIEPYLRNGDPEVRAAALDAILVLGHADGAPLLREAAKSAESSEEAANLEKAADYLELPPADLSKRRKKKNTQEIPQASEQ
jgi:hypothetical protein